MAQLPCENNLQGVNFCCAQINIKPLTIMKLRHVLLFTVIVLEEVKQQTRVFNLFLLEDYLQNWAGLFKTGLR